MNSYEVHTICTDRALECCPTAVTFETVVAFKTCAIVETGVTLTFANATWTYTYKNSHLMDSHLTLWHQLFYTEFVYTTLYMQQRGTDKYSKFNTQWIIKNCKTRLMQNNFGLLHHWPITQPIKVQANADTSRYSCSGPNGDGNRFI